MITLTYPNFLIEKGAYLMYMVKATLVQLSAKARKTQQK